MLDENRKNLLIAKEKLDYMRREKVSAEVLKYLSNKFINLKIEIGSSSQGGVFDLMRKGLLEGWCWQTTESSILFLNDDDYIGRGNLKFIKYRDYYHSWICFKYNDCEYVFDPCLNILCKKDLYMEMLDVEIMAKPTSREVYDDLVMRMNMPIKKQNLSEADLAREAFLKVYGGNILDSKKDEFYVVGNDDITSPMYRNSTGYKVHIEDGKVKKLVAHYYSGEKYGKNKIR